MRLTESRRLGVAALSTTLVLLAGCGTGTSATDETAAATGSTTASPTGELPAHLTEVLARDSLVVTSTSFSSGEISASEALDAFSRVYDPKMFEHDPTLYEVVVESSQETRLPPGLTVWMIHIPSVEQDASGPVPPSTSSGDDDGGRTTIVVTDMFTFIDAKSGGHLATVYIGPAR